MMTKQKREGVWPELLTVHYSDGGSVDVPVDRRKVGDSVHCRNGHVRRESWSAPELLRGRKTCAACRSERDEACKQAAEALGLGIVAYRAAYGRSVDTARAILSETRLPRPVTRDRVGSPIPPEVDPGELDPTTAPPTGGAQRHASTRLEPLSP